MASLWGVAIVLSGCGDGGDEPSAIPTVAVAAAPSTTAPVRAPAGSGDGCSTDNSPTEVAAAPDPAPVIAVDAASADNELPDLAVRRINCAGGWVNLKNEIPADRPLLVWFWAPY